MRTDAEIIRHTIKLTIDYFDGDTTKASLWLNTENALFADTKPLDYIYLKPLRGEEVVLNLLGGNSP
jgi:hypothetical protein